MKTRIFGALALCASLALAGCLGPDSPEDQLKAIQDLQAKKLPMTAAQKTSLDQHLAKGREALEAGNKEAASTSLGEALAILKTAEDTALYNKAD